MATNVTAQLDPRHVLLSDVHPRMAKASIQKTDVVDWKAQFGKVIERVQGTLTLKEFSDAISRDGSQVKRWIDGKERPHFDAIFAVEKFRGALVLAIADLAPEAVDVVTTISVKRSA